MIGTSGRPIAAPSANRSTGISPTLARHVLKDLDGKIDLVLDSGPTTLGLESTVLDLSDDRLRILRPGGVTLEEIAGYLGEPVDGPSPSADPDQSARSPGQMLVHYAPATPTFRLDRLPSEDVDRDATWALIAFGPEEERPDGPSLVIRLVDPSEAARSLYAVLHDCDDRHLRLHPDRPAPPRTPMASGPRPRQPGFSGLARPAVIFETETAGLSPGGDRSAARVVRDPDEVEGRVSLDRCRPGSLRSGHPGRSSRTPRSGR